MRGLLDTSVIIARADELEVEALPEEAAISVATLAELHYGVLVAANDETRRQRLERLGLVEAGFQPLPIDAAVARAFARVAHTVKLAGRQPRARVMDLWIAATALSQGLPLFTRDRDAFAPLRELLQVILL
jgi:predicted nucleic acid-binding protein